MVQALRKGEIDFAEGLSANTFASLEGAEDITTVAGASTGYNQIGVQHRGGDRGRRADRRRPPGLRRCAVPAGPGPRDRPADHPRQGLRRLRRPGHHDHPAHLQEHAPRPRRPDLAVRPGRGQPAARRGRLPPRGRRDPHDARRHQAAQGGALLRPLGVADLAADRALHQGLVRRARHRPGGQRHRPEPADRGHRQRRVRRLRLGLGRGARSRLHAVGLHLRPAQHPRRGHVGRGPVRLVLLR